MGARVLPVHEMKAIEQLLPPTRQIEHVVMGYTPSSLASVLGPNSPMPNAWASLLWAAHACQAAWCHLYLAHHDRCYYSRYKKPPKPETANALAAWFFTSFSLHAVAAENHLALALLLADGGKFKKGWAPGAAKIATKLNPKLVSFLQPLIDSGTSWQWVRDYRNRWVHLDPVRIKELGLQWMESCDRSYWKHDPIAKTLTCGIGGSDPGEATVNEMLDHGRGAFHLFARQYALAVDSLDNRVRNEWQAWNPLAKVFRHKKPRKRHIPWLRSIKG